MIREALSFIRGEWRFSITLLALLIVYVKLSVTARRVRKVLDSRTAYQRRRDLFRRLFGGN